METPLCYKVLRVESLVKKIANDKLQIANEENRERK
jgi:hypothetical protein